jgi:hypothetical protein
MVLTTVGIGQQMTVRETSLCGLTKGADMFHLN